MISGVQRPAAGRVALATSALADSLTDCREGARAVVISRTAVRLAVNRIAISGEVAQLADAAFGGVLGVLGVRRRSSTDRPGAALQVKGAEGASRLSNGAAGLRGDVQLKGVITDAAVAVQGALCVEANSPAAEVRRGTALCDAGGVPAWFVVSAKVSP